MAKASMACSEERLNDVIKMLSDGYSRVMIEKHAKIKKWNITLRQIDNYIAKANEYFRSLSEVKREDALGTLADRYRNLYEKCLKDRDYKTAAQITEKLSRLLGLADNDRDKEKLQVNIVVSLPERLINEQ